MHAGILFGLRPSENPSLCTIPGLHVAIGENVIVEVGELGGRVFVDLAAKRDWKSFGGAARQVLGAQVDRNVGDSDERLRRNSDRGFHQRDSKFLDAKIPGGEFLG